MTEFLNVDGGTIAYEVTGATGPLVVLAHGMGDSRAAYRFLIPALVEAGYRVAAVDLRGPRRALHRRRCGHDRRGQGPGVGHRAGRARTLHPQAADPDR